MNSILSSTIYNRSHNFSITKSISIPDNFDWKVYAAIVKDPSINNSSTAYKHFKQKCTVNSHNYRLYWRTIYKIPNNFVEESYKKYINYNNKNFQFNNFEELYKFYVTKGINLYPLNDKYSRIHFEIPDDFDPKIYITVYPEALKPNDNQIYHFYHYNKESFPLNSQYYRLLYNIPDIFDIQIYNQRYNFNYNENNSYQFYNNVGRNSYPLDDHYLRLLYNIHKDFDIHVYNQRYNFNYNETNSYQFYNNIGQFSYPLDDHYYRLLYNIPKDFDIHVYNQRYNFKYNETNSYQFYNNIGQFSYPLDDHYYRLLYNIPQDFHLENYKKRYNLDLSNIETYLFYHNNIDCRELEFKEEPVCHINLSQNNINLHIDIDYNDHSDDANNDANNDVNNSNVEINIECNNDVNDLESNNDSIDSNNDFNDMECNNIREILKIPQDFNYENYNLRYQLNLNEVECYKYYKNNKLKYCLDETYYRIQYNISTNLTSKYLDSYKTLYPHIFKTNCQIQDIFKFYNESSNNLKKQNLNINLTEKYHYILDLIDPDAIFKDEVFFYDFYYNNIQLKHIYQTYLKNPNSELGKIFIQNYEYLDNYKEYICNEESKRKYFLINDFVDEYFSNSNILIDQKSYFPEKKTIQKTRTITKKRKINKQLNTDSNILPDSNIFSNLNSILNDDKNNKNLLLEMFKNMKEKSQDNLEEYEDYEEEETYNEETNYYPIIKIPLYTTFFCNLEKENKKYKYNFKDIYCLIQKCQNFYNIFTQQKIIIESFKNYKPLSSNNKYCAVVFLNDNYLHNYLSILNNLKYLSKVSNLYILINKSIEDTKQFSFYLDLISSKFNVKKIYLENDFTFNDFNNLMLSMSFWNNFDSDYIILFSTLTFLKNDLFINEIDISNFNTFYVSNNVNKNNYYASTLFSIRSKKYILSILKDLNIEFNKDEIINENIRQINFSLNIDKHIETFLLQNFINNNIFYNYLENMENSFYYLDLEFKLINTILNMR
jgi:hypothetical protein